MIITRPKSMTEIKTILKRFEDARICVAGCGICARKVETGGEPQVRELVEQLRRMGFNVPDGIMVKHACSTSSWQDLVREVPELDRGEVLLLMSCGAGVSLLGRISGRPTLSALDTTSLGGAVGDDTLEGLCCMCGECNVGIFAGLCPKAGCPKSLMNGPCGGFDDGDCEIGGQKCIWVKIYEVLEARDVLTLLNELRPPVQHDRRL